MGTWRGGCREGQNYRKGSGSSISDRGLMGMCQGQECKWTLNLSPSFVTCMKEEGTHGDGPELPACSGI